MKRNYKLNKSLGGFSRKKQTVEETYYGELGTPLNGRKVVEVPGRNGFVYVRLLGNTSELIQARNQSVPPIYDLPVILKRVKASYSIVGRDNAKYSNVASGAGGGVVPLPRHGGQHSLNPEAGMGADVVWVYSRQFMHNLLHHSGTSMNLALQPAFYEWNGQFKYINPTGSVNLAPYLPSATGSARMALVWLEGDTGNLRVSAGAGFSGGISNNWDIAGYIPDIDRNSGMPLMAVKLDTGTTSLDWSNLYDVRDFLTVQKRFSGIGIQDSTTPKGTGTILNFGNNLSVTMAGGVATIDATAGGGGGGGIGIMGWDEGVPIGTGTILNFVGQNVEATRSGTVINVFVTGSSGGSNPPVTGSLVFWDEGVPKGSATILNVVGANADVSISGTVARLFIDAPSTGSATYFRVGQPTPLSSTTGTYWKVPDNVYSTGSLAVFNQGHALIVGTDYSPQYPESGTYQYTEAQPTGTYHLALYGVPATLAGSSSSPSEPGRVLISESSPSGTSTVTFSSIPQTYKHLIIEIMGRSTKSDFIEDLNIELNADTTASNYRYSYHQIYAGGLIATASGDDRITGRMAAASSPSNSAGTVEIRIPYYKLGFKKGITSVWTLRYDEGGTQLVSGHSWLEWENTSAITQIDLKFASGNWNHLSRISLYGII